MTPYDDYTPLSTHHPMSWPPVGCCWCGAPEMAWAYPIGEVTFWRTPRPGEPQQELRHDAQPWFACARCKALIDAGELDELARLVDRPPGHFEPLRQARLKGPGYPWHRPARR